MTAQKPPDKTLVGMPADLKAVLEKLDQATADKSAFSDPPRGSAFDPNPARQAARPRTPPPPPPISANERPAPPSPAPPPAAYAAHDPGAVAMDRTLIGMPSDMQAALARAIAEQANAHELPPPSVAPSRPVPPRAPAPRTPPPRTPPTAAGPALRAQPVRAIGVPNAPGSEAQVAVQGARGPVPAPKPTAPASYQPVPPRAAPTYASGLGYQSGPTYQDPSRPVLAPQAPLDWPPAARRSEPGLAPVRLDQTADAADEQALLDAEGAEHALSGEQQLDEESFAVGEERSRLALPLSTFDSSKEKGKRRGPNKRWIVLAVGGLGVAALAGVGVWLAPKLLGGRAADSENASPVAAADAPALAPTPPSVVTDTSAATDPVRFTPTPTRPPAAPAMTSGPSAQLEKKAIERLIANDYPAAKQLYEKLRSAEPTRSEFALMLELLNRAGARGCGQPGQTPCAGVEP